MQKWIIVIVIILLTISLSFGVQLFLIGEPVDGNAVFLDISEEDSVLYLYVMTADSAFSFCGESRHIADGVLHISLRKVLASPLHSSGMYIIPVETADLTEIYFCGKPVWSSK